MKTLKNILIISLILTVLTSCNTNDDDFYNSQYITIPNLIQIETQPTYAVNDYIYVNTTINRLQNEVGQTTQVDLRKSTGNANAFNFVYLIEKKINATEWQAVSVNNSNTITTKGRFFGVELYNAYADFDTVADAYKFKTGIKLESAGQYRMSFGNSNSLNNNVAIVSQSEGTNLILSINSFNSNLDGAGYYNFTVN